MKDIQNIFKCSSLFQKAGIACCLCLALLYGCKKADNFYETLDGLLQVDGSADRAYRTSYVVGDTLQIYGLLKADKDLEVWINGIKGNIIDKSLVDYRTSEGDQRNMDRIRVLISEEMIGSNLPVEFRNGDLRGTGPAIDVLSYYGNNSFTQELTQQTTYTFPDRSNIFLYCASGKGDVYYYSQTDKRIRHIGKDGTSAVIKDLSLPLPDGANVQEFLAGGVDPGKQNLYFSVHTDKGYALYRMILANQNLTLLNSSASIGAPFSGQLSAVQIAVTSIYPDKNGNLFLGIGNSTILKSLPVALAYCTAADQSFSYLYKWDGSVPGLPAELLPLGTDHRGWRLNPDEKRLYILGFSNITGFAIDVYDTESRVKLQRVSFAGGNDPFTFVGNFPSLKINLSNGNTNSPDLCFGLMPMPGNRLQALLYQYYQYPATNELASGRDFPKWTVFDFDSNRTYAYAKGKFDQGAVVFNPSTYLFPKNSAVDELLNWDEDGHLYMSTNGKKLLIKTKTQ
ncbi:hypothetical protein [Chitinophaga defluvii]|uniref:Uncharacterized protein n=1 Tax=Chitinophaga defluvii TaxID=3163343 RepID=A0ABV2T975_9BACT